MQRLLLLIVILLLLSSLSVPWFVLLLVLVLDSQSPTDQTEVIRGSVPAVAIPPGQLRKRPCPLVQLLANPVATFSLIDLLKRNWLPCQLAAEEIPHQSGDFGMFILQRKMSGVEQSKRWTASKMWPSAPLPQLCERKGLMNSGAEAVR